MICGKDYIGVSVGAMVFNHEGKVFLAKRGPLAANEHDHWEFPVGQVAFGEMLIDAVIRKFDEEYGLAIEIMDLLSVSDHFIPEDEQHWVSPTFIARHSGHDPDSIETETCAEVGWFDLTSLPYPLSVMTIDNLQSYMEKYDEAPCPYLTDAAE